MAPAYLLDDQVTHQDLIASPEERALIGPELATIELTNRTGRAFVGQTPHLVEVYDETLAWRSLAPKFRKAFPPPGVVVPVQADYRHLGVIMLAFDHGWRMDEPTRAYLEVVGRILGRYWYRWLKSSREHELGALQERRRISEELHVDLSQQVTALSLRLQTLRLDLADPEQASQDLAVVDHLVNGIKRSLRSKMLGLRQDEALIREGLVHTLEGHVEAARTRYQLPIDLSCPSEAEQVPLQVAAQLVRVMQESLANACLHAECTRVQVRVTLPGTVVRLAVIDNGVGLDAERMKSDHLGMRVMSERMALIGGRITLGAAPDGGTMVTAEAPIQFESRPLLERTAGNP
ncbi:histidine kinase/DNA gyrase B/HSP90-like ATPase [Propionicimonas paludicola]|uniref:histidine kinase n=1 Tax=Propionicimonas paludicola TaxID=185243 RepID=A0A2A9CN46_9ACTN|nr:ATP-binding protein [Propionicimonas paludicola]PFG15611.1 histidine kinase/DNA gyrase B/HSP90-like ATPase [Propionicimonas paludicola]